MNPTPVHRCSVPGCQRTVPLDKLMCWSHWHCVPGFLRRKVYAVWWQYQDGHVGVDVLRDVQAEATLAVTSRYPERRTALKPAGRKGGAA